MQKPVIVKGEDPEAFTALHESLTAEYQPETQMQQIIVMEAARAAWELARANREFDKSQQKFYDRQENMHEWDAAQQAEFERMFRYRTRAERAYARGLQAVEYLRKLRLQAEQRAFWENLQTERLELSKQRLDLAVARMQKASEPKVNRKEAEKLAQEEEKAARRRLWAEEPVPLSQIIEIRMLDDGTSIQTHPLAEDMLSDCGPGEPKRVPPALLRISRWSSGRICLDQRAGHSARGHRMGAKLQKCSPLARRCGARSSYCTGHFLPCIDSDQGSPPALL
ncbi:MAG TPA: hypothetical protein VGG97_16815 [Bryobacteraceae bacterium]